MHSKESLPGKARQLEPPRFLRFCCMFLLPGHVDYGTKRDVGTRRDLERSHRDIPSVNKTLFHPIFATVIFSLLLILSVHKPGESLVTAQSYVSVYFTEGNPGQGIGGCDLRSPADRLFAFDYDHSGKTDHLVLTCRGTGTAWISKKAPDGVLTAVDAQGDSDNRIGGYDLRLRQKSRCI